MGRKFQLGVGEFYHLYNRGNDRRVIFLDDNDKERFIKLLFLCNDSDSLVFRDFSAVKPKKVIHNIGSTYVNQGREPITDIGAYCLMQNHFHILAREKTEDGISRFMQKLSTAYTMYFNKKHGRSGALFEGRFKAKFADKDDYLEYLFSYIHLNPIKLIDPEWKERGIGDLEAAKKFLSDYPYSSYLDYIGRERPEKSILNYSAFPDYFQSTKEFEAVLGSWLNYDSDSIG